MNHTVRGLLISGLLLLLPGLSVAQQLVNCATNIPCSPTGPKNTGTGDQAPTAMAKLNANNIQLYGMFGPSCLLKGNGAVPNPLTCAMPSDVAPIMPGLTGDVVSTPGSVNTTVSSTGGVPFGPCATLDCSNASNITGGLFSLSVLPGSSVSYPAAVSVPIGSGNNTNFIDQSFAGAWSATLPAVGSSGINAGVFQTWLFNAGAYPGTITPTTSTINGLASVPAPPGDSVLIASDNTGSNYVAIPIAGSGNHTIVGDTIYQPLSTNSGPSSSATPRIILDETDQQANTNTEFWGIESSSTVFSIRPYAGAGVGVTPTAGSGNPGINITRGASGSAGSSVLNILFGGTTSGGGGTYTFTGTGATSFAGTVKSPLLVLNGSALCATSGQSCLYQPASNQIGFGGVPSGVPTEYAYFDAAGSFHQLFDSYIAETTPRILFNETDQSGNTNTSIWSVSSANGIFSINTLTDAFGAGTNGINITRGASGSTTGPQITNISFGNLASATSYSFPGTGTATFGGIVKGTAIIANGSSLGGAGTAGIYNPSGSQLGFFSNGTQAGYFDSSQNLFTAGAIVSIGSVPSITAISGTCTYGTPTGGQRVNFMTITGGSGTCSFKATYATSLTNGYSCKGSDETQVTALTQASHTTNSCTVRVTSAATNDTLQWTADGG